VTEDGGGLRLLRSYREICPDAARFVRPQAVGVTSPVFGIMIIYYWLSLGKHVTRTSSAVDSVQLCIAKPAMATGTKKTG